MADYIERGNAFDAVMGQFCACSDETEEALNGAIEDIRKIPTADVRPVRHGRWVDSELDGVPSHCSECNYPIERFYKTRFCPNCGAKMENNNE